MEQRLRILFVSAEVTPFAKTGGLGDVVGALPAALAAQGHDVRVVMPLYQSVQDSDYALTDMRTELSMQLVTGPQTARVWQHPLPQSASTSAEVPVYFIEQNDFFARPGLYGDGTGDYPDNAARFAFFSRSAIALTQQLEWTPQVFHCNDWHTALLPAYLRFLPELAPQFEATATLYTIHNFAYQGVFPGWAFLLTALPPGLFQPDGMEFYGFMNFMKAGLFYADRITTVSPSYAEEIGTPDLGFGLDGAIRARREALVGILNGVDYGVWNPESDQGIAAQYSADDLSGKAACKAALLQTYSLPEDPTVPLIGFISRLVDQKGIDLLLGALDSLLQRNVRFTILGSGEPRYEEQLRQFGQRYPDRLGVRIGFDDTLAHKIEAGSDCFLMPSRYEPCGLNQMYSLRYGTIPIVRATGGLRDSVLPFNSETESGTGFLFQEPTPEALRRAVQDALDAFANTERWQRLMLSAMQQDFSWTRSAARYIDLYQEVLAERQGTTKGQ